MGGMSGCVQGLQVGTAGQGDKAVFDPDQVVHGDGQDLTVEEGDILLGPV